MWILTPEAGVDVSDRLIIRLRKAGYRTYEAVDNVTAIDISTYAGITLQQAQNIKKQAKKHQTRVNMFKPPKISPSIISQNTNILVT